MNSSSLISGAGSRYRVRTYRDIEWQKLFMALALVLSLAFVRIIAIRFSPMKDKEPL
jgi:hypothetical protein